ncbi:hypothetical protein [Enterococcus casseliflavus]|uniref:hypothetical protein n=1 Tax=Enterococcus casseliflavus TaxID=37734 RepID=UPI0029533217|nr:hypothetical protein [Enterococcus casseliflavus]MDV7688739.1 hypothetical protein [Enterococcus casseliflavus]
MDNFEFTTRKIIKYTYIQSDPLVSIEKILSKFNYLTRDDLNTILNNMEQSGFVEFYPKNNFSFVDGIYNEGDPLENYDISESLPITEFSHIKLTLKGKDDAEEQRALWIKLQKELYTKPVVNTAISGIIGFLIGYLLQYLQ